MAQTILVMPSTCTKASTICEMMSTIRPIIRIGPALSMLNLVVMPNMVSAKKNAAVTPSATPIEPRS